MTLSELIATVGNANVQFQMLDTALINVEASKRITRVTFGTQAITPGSVVAENHPVGIIVWIPRDLFNAVIKNLSQPSTTDAA